MRHLTEEELIIFRYGESEAKQRSDHERLRAHLAQCVECAERMAAQERDLAEMRFDVPAPRTDAQYGEHVWDTLAGLLKPHSIQPEQRNRFQWGWRWSIALAGAVAMLAVAAFYSGRVWEKQIQPKAIANGKAPEGQTGYGAQQSIVLFVVNDHLARSQRLLAELDNSDAAIRDGRLQATAQELLAQNRLYRQTEAHGTSSDDELKGILDQLEPVLVELANEPTTLKRAEILRLRRKLGTGELLLEIRVLRTRQPASIEPEPFEKSISTQARKGGAA